MIGYSCLSKTSLTIKVFPVDPNTFNNLDSETSFLAEDEKGHLIAISKSECIQNKIIPKYIHSINCIMRTDLLQDGDFKKSFNYMENYRFKKVRMPVFDPKSYESFTEDSYIAHIPFDSIYQQIPSYSLFVDSVDNYSFIHNDNSFAASQISFLRRQNKGIALNSSIQRLINQSQINQKIYNEQNDIEVDNRLFYYYEDILDCPINKIDVISNKLYLQ